MAKRNVGAAVPAGVQAQAQASGSVATASPEMLAMFNDFMAQHAGKASASTVQTVAAADGSAVELASKVMSDAEVRTLADHWHNGYGAISKAARALHHGEMTAAQCFTYFFSGREPGEVKRTQQAFNMSIRRLSDNALSFKVDTKKKSISVDKTASRAPRTTTPPASAPAAAGQASAPAVAVKPGDEPDAPAVSAPASPEAVSLRVVGSARSYLKALPTADRHAAALRLASDMASLLAEFGAMEEGRAILKAADKVKGGSAAAPAKTAGKKK